MKTEVVNPFSTIICFKHFSRNFTTSRQEFKTCQKSGQAERLFFCRTKYFRQNSISFFNYRMDVYSVCLRLMRHGMQVVVQQLCRIALSRAGSGQKDPAD